MKADHNTITPFGVKVMSKYKVLSKRERGVIKKRIGTLYVNIGISNYIGQNSNV